MVWLMWIRISVPPEKSTLSLGPPCNTSHAAVARTNRPENTYVKRRYFISGKSVPTRSWSMGSDAQALDLAPAEHEIEDHAREQNGGEHVGDQPHAQRDGEALDRAGAELEEEEGADQRGQVGVENGAEGTVVAQGDRLTNALLVAQLLTNALEDQHVGVDCHADREHQTRDAGQRERGAEPCQRRHHVDGVEDQSGDRDAAG